MCPHWAPGATRPQCPLHLAISDVLGLLWAIGATIWTTPISTHFQTIYVPNEPWEPLHINVIYIWPLYALCVPIEPREPPGFNTFTFSYFGSRSPVSHRSHYMNHVKIYPFSDVLCPQWALGATLYEYHIHLAARCTMCPHWAPGATRLQHPLHLAISDVPGPLWAIGATIWITPRSIHFQTFHVPNEPSEALHINVIYI